MDKNINSAGGTCFNTADSISRHRSPSSARRAHQIEPTVGSSLWWACRRLSGHLGSQDDGARFSSELLPTLELAPSSRWTTQQKRRQVPNKNSRPISRASSMHTPWRRHNGPSVSALWRRPYSGAFFPRGMELDSDMAELEPIAAWVSDF